MQYGWTQEKSGESEPETTREKAKQALEDGNALLAQAKQAIEEGQARAVKEVEAAEHKSNTAVA